MRVAIDGRVANARSRRLSTALVLALILGTALLVPGEIRRAEAATVAEPHHFTLTTLDGATVTDQSYGGKWLVVYFGYTDCPDECPTALGKIGKALDALGPLADKVQPLFITIDPDRDKPRVIAAYLKNFDSRIIGLRGTPDQLEDTKKQFHAHYERHDLENGSHEVDHTGFLYVLGPSGEFEKLDITDQDVDQRLAAELRKGLQ
jgi:protein SCO1/2